MQQAEAAVRKRMGKNNERGGRNAERRMRIKGERRKTGKGTEKIGGEGEGEERESE